MPLGSIKKESGQIGLKRVFQHRKTFRFRTNKCLDAHLLFAYLGEKILGEQQMAHVTLRGVLVRGFGGGVPEVRLT